MNKLWNMTKGILAVGICIYLPLLLLSKVTIRLMGTDPEYYGPIELYFMMPITTGVFLVIAFGILVFTYQVGASIGNKNEEEVEEVEE